MDALNVQNPYIKNVVSPRVLLNKNKLTLQLSPEPQGYFNSSNSNTNNIFTPPNNNKLFTPQNDQDI